MRSIPSPCLPGGKRNLLLFAALLSLAGSPALGEQEVQPLPAHAREQAVLLSALTFPAPGEFFAALAKAGRPNFTPAARVPVPISVSERPRIALLIGVLLADGFLAVENQNGQDMKNIGKDLMEMAGKLNAGENVVARGRSITDFAENNDWNSLREELEATRNEIRMSLTAQKDPGLSLLVSLGAWLRAIHAGTLVVNRNYAAEPAALFRQSDLVDAWQRRASILPPRFLNNAWVGFTLENTVRIGDIMRPENNGDTALPPEAMTAIEDLAAGIMARLIEAPPGENPVLSGPENDAVESAGEAPEAKPENNDAPAEKAAEPKNPDPEA